MTLLAFLGAACAESSAASRVEACVEATKFGALVGDIEATEMWDAAGRTEDALRVACDDLEISDPQRVTAMNIEWEATQRAIREARTTSSTPADNRCDPSYPAMCIRMDEPDLDCSNVGASDFPVVQPDRHRFDTDGDGFGCVPGVDFG